MQVGRDCMPVGREDNRRHLRDDSEAARLLEAALAAGSREARSGRTLGLDATER
jgi:hypothetical protein